MTSLASSFNGQEGTVCFWLDSLGDITTVPTIPFDVFRVSSRVASTNNILSLQFMPAGTAVGYTKITYTCGATSSTITDADALATDADSVFVAATWSLTTGAGQISLYTNGVLVSTVSDIGTWGTAAPTSFKMTANPSLASLRHIGIWSMALTYGQITAIYDASLSNSVQFIPELGATSAKLRLINPIGADMYLTSLTISGKRIKAYKPLICQAYDANTIGRYGRPGIVTMKFDMPYQNDEGAGKDFASYILNRYKNPLNSVESMTFSANKNAYLEEMAYKVKIGQRINLSERQSGISGNFFVNGIEYVQMGERLDVTLYLQSEDNVYWLIGTAGYSEIGTTTYLGF